MMGGGLVSSSLLSPRVDEAAGAVAAATAPVAAGSRIYGESESHNEADNEKRKDSGRSIHLFNETVNSRGNNSTARVGGVDDHAKVLRKRLSEKASVKISLLGQPVHGCNRSNKQSRRWMLSSSGLSAFAGCTVMRSGHQSGLISINYCNSNYIKPCKQGIFVSFSIPLYVITTIKTYWKSCFANISER